MHKSVADMQHFCYDDGMTTKTERIAVTTEKGVKEQLERLARENKSSVSKIAADMISFALEIREDIYLDDLATERTSHAFKTISHRDMWK